MNISINSKRLNVTLDKDEVLILNTIIDKIDFITLKKIISNNMNEKKLVELLKSLYEKEVILIDNPALLNVTSFNSRSSSTYLYSNTNISEQLENLYQKIKENKNFYDILGVSPSATIKEIRYVYFKLSKRYHPDIIKKYRLPKDIKTQVDFIMLELSNIFNILKSPEKRKEYDRNLNIFKKKVIKARTAKVKQKEGHSDKSKEYFLLAQNEYYIGNFDKSLKLLKLALSYDPHNKDALKLKDDVDVLINKNNINSIMKNIDKELAIGNYYEAFELVNDLIIDYGDKKEFLLKKVKVLEKLGFTKNKNKIMSLLQDILVKNPKDIRTREALLEYLKLADDKDALKKQAKELLEIDPKNKVAKKYMKGKLWNMF